MSDRAPSHPPALRAASPGRFGVRRRAGTGTAALHASAQRLGLSSPRRLGGGDVAPSLHRRSSLRYRVRPAPCRGAPLCRGAGSLPAPARAVPRVLRVSGASCCRRAGPRHSRDEGHPLLQPHRFLPKTSLEEAAGGLGGTKGSVAFLVFGNPFFSPFTLLSLPRAEAGRRQPAALHEGRAATSPFDEFFSPGDQFFTLPDWWRINRSVGF